MLLKDRIAAHGTFLFRWRSYLPLFLAIPALAALPQSEYLELWLGETAEDFWDIGCIAIAL